MGSAEAHYRLNGDALEADCIEPDNPPDWYLRFAHSTEVPISVQVLPFPWTRQRMICDGIYILTGEIVTWAYKVTNTGNVPLTNIRVDDSVAGPVGTIDSLDPGESQTLTLAGTAIAGSYENTGTAAGTPPVGED
jgi:uncharacterized repeat protein (TIGR01451 family)